MKKITKADNKAKNMNGFIIAGIIALILACAGYVALIIVENKVLGGYNKTNVVVYSADMGKGTKIQGNEFSVMEIDSYAVPKGTLTVEDVDNLVGKYLTRNVTQNSMCMVEDFQSHEQDSDRFMELTFSAPNLNGNLAGAIRTSDYVDIYFIPNGVGNVFGNTIYTGEQFYLQMLERKLEEMMKSYEDGTATYYDTSVSEEDYGNIQTILNKINELKSANGESTDFFTMYSTFFKDCQGMVQDLLEKFGELELLEEYKACLKSVGNLKPDYEGVYIEDAYTQDGVKVANLDNVSVATQFRVRLSKEEASDFITREQYCTIWLVKNNNPEKKMNDTTVTE